MSEFKNFKGFCPFCCEENGFSLSDDEVENDFHFSCSFCERDVMLSEYKYFEEVVE